MKRDESIHIIIFCLAGNIILMLLKGAVGLAVGSPVLRADAVNSAGDALSSFVVLLGLRYALKPRDEDHHYGHGKMEALVSLFVGIAILVGIGFLISDIVRNIIVCQATEPSFYALGAAAVSIAVKAVMFKRTYAAGKRLGSIAVMTTAKDHRNDIFATSGAAVAIILAFIGQRYGIRVLLLYAEPVIAAVISLFIIKTALEIIIESSRMLLDAAPERKTVEDVGRIVRDTEGVMCLNWAKLRMMGRGLLVDIAIEVDSDITVQQGHAIGHAVKEAVMAHYPEVIDMIVHVNAGGCRED